MAKSNPSKSAKPAAKAEGSAEAAPAKKETKPVAAATKPAAPAKAAAPPKPATAAKAAAPKGKKAETKPAAPSAAPVIDTSLAAANAAKLLANRNPNQNRTGGDKPNSAGFRQMKEGLSKAVSPASIPFLPGNGSQKKSGQAFGGHNQVGHNQTFGADVNRSGVPRRTGGG